MAERTWNGRLVPLDEPPDAVISVWAISPGPRGAKYDTELVRCWERLDDRVREIVDSHLDAMDEQDLREPGFALTIKLIETTRGEYDEAISGDSPTRV